MSEQECPTELEQLRSFLEIQAGQTEIFSRKMMEFKAECDSLRASNKELRDVVKFYVKWGESQIKPCPWDVGRIHNRGRVVLGLKPLDLLSATQSMAEREARAAGIQIEGEGK